MVHGEAPDEKPMRLGYAGVCRICGMALAARSEAIYERSTKTVRCAHHADPGVNGPELDDAVEAGTPGASARREFERRRAAREQRIRDKHPRIGGLIHALSDDPQSTRAWDTGAIGEERLGHRLNELASETLRVLHDRRVPGGRTNIDHVAVTPAGVYVIDAKKYRGRPRLRIEGGLLRPRVEKLIVGNRDRTKVVDGVLHQVEIVRGVVGEAVPVPAEDEAPAVDVGEGDRQVDRDRGESSWPDLAVGQTPLPSRERSTPALQPVSPSELGSLPSMRERDLPIVRTP